jgi:hypothetical protein
VDSPEILKNLEMEKMKPVEERADFDLETEQEISPERQRVEKFIQEREAPKEAPAAGAPSVGEAGINFRADPLHQTVESILEDNLGDLYFTMDEKKQAEFKKKGEETTAKIVKLMRSAKSTFRKIFDLIRKWLKIIPGVNKFFIDQEAKIKADKIVEITR